MSDRVLCVDDDAAMRRLVQKQLRSVAHIDTAADADQALAMLGAGDPYAVVLSDMRMPRQDGVELLARIKVIAPATVRILFTGYADLEAAFKAVNHGNVFRLITKPYELDELLGAVNAGIEQYRLVMASKELLEKTLNGSVRVLTEILSIFDPVSFGRAQRLRTAIRSLAIRTGADNLWELEIAAMLSLLGQVGVPTELLARVSAGEEISAEEAAMVTRAPDLAFRIIQSVPRLESVARIILYQGKRFDGCGFPKDAVKGEAIPLGSRMLKVLADLEKYEAGGVTRQVALAQMRVSTGVYDPHLIELLSADAAGNGQSSAPVTSTTVAIEALRVGDILMQKLLTRSGQLLLADGTELTTPLLERVRNYAGLQQVGGSLLVKRG